MSRIQKKCLIVSLGIHLSLVVLLIVGPGFISSRTKDNAPPQLDFIPVATVDAVLSGGGDNTVKAPPAELVEPPAQPAPVIPPAPVTPPVVDQTPPPPVERREHEAPMVKDTPLEDPKSDMPSPRSAPHRREIVPDLKVVTSSAADVKARRAAQAKAAAAERRRTEMALNRAIGGIRGGVAGSTEVRLRGPGGGGLPYGNIEAAIKSRYLDAWTVPEGVPDLKVDVTITLARDGTVVSARITDRSGNAALDNSVQDALDRVKYIAPLPEGEKQDTREFSFGFKPEMKSSG